MQCPFHTQVISECISYERSFFFLFHGTKPNAFEMLWTQLWPSQRPTHCICTIDIQMYTLQRHRYTDTFNVQQTHINILKQKVDRRHWPKYITISKGKWTWAAESNWVRMHWKQQQNKNTRISNDGERTHKMCSLHSSKTLTTGSFVFWNDWTHYNVDGKKKSNQQKLKERTWKENIARAFLFYFIFNSSKDFFKTVVCWALSFQICLKMIVAFIAFLFFSFFISFCCCCGCWLPDPFHKSQVCSFLFRCLLDDIDHNMNFKRRTNAQ